jgi:hypothetical protein
MKALITVIVMAAAGVPNVASAQGVNLTGQYRCIRVCTDVTTPAFVTQNGSNLRLSTTGGQSTYAWVDYPGHIWIEPWYEGALYSPDGMVIQFDRGAVWQRDIGQFDDARVLPPVASERPGSGPYARARKPR